MTDPSLPDAKRQFATAVTALLDPRPAAFRDRTVWIDPVYLELRKAIYGTKQGTSGRVAQSSPPLWVDGVDLLTTIDSTVKGWERHGGGPSPYATVNRLRAMLTRGWRPQDATAVIVMADTVTGWTGHYYALTEPKPKHLPNPCPHCSSHHAYRKVDGERVRVPALQVTTERCICLVCRKQWPAAMFGLLAAQLGYAPPAGVIQ